MSYLLILFRYLLIGDRNSLSFIVTRTEIWNHFQRTSKKISGKTHLVTVYYIVSEIRIIYVPLTYFYIDFNSYIVVIGVLVVSDRYKESGEGVG